MLLKNAAVSPRVERFLRLAIFVLIFATAFFTRLFSIVRFESIIHEFDPWFNYRATQKLTSDGFYSFWNWFDDRSWYPLGRVVGGTVYPGLMFTAAIFHKILCAFNIPLDIRNICVFLAPFFSMLTSYAMYQLTCEFHSKTAGLFAAGFMAIAPGYISRSVAGSYDNEAIAIYLLVYCFYLWIKAVKSGSVFYGLSTAAIYLYMVSAWGGYVFITNMIPLHVFVLLIMGRYSHKLYSAYCSWYVIATLSSLMIPFVSFAPVRTSEHMAAMGVFGLLQIVAFTDYLKSLVSKSYFKYLVRIFISTFVAVTGSLLVSLTYAGHIAPWSGRFYSLWDTGYAKIHIPIIASVSEHQPTAWSSLFFDLHHMVVLLPAGLILCFRRLRNEHVFVIIYCVLASYFAGVMVRLILTLTPIVCSASGIAIGEAYGAVVGRYSKLDESIESGEETSSTSAKAKGLSSERTSSSYDATARSVKTNHDGKARHRNNAKAKAKAKNNYDDDDNDNDNDNNNNEFSKQVQVSADEEVGNDNDNNSYNDEDGSGEKEANDYNDNNDNSDDDDGEKMPLVSKGKDKGKGKGQDKTNKDQLQTPAETKGKSKGNATSSNTKAKNNDGQHKRASGGIGGSGALLSKANNISPMKKVFWNQMMTLCFSFSLFLLMFYFVLHSTWVTSSAYSSPSVVLASNGPDGSRNLIDDFREAYYWLRKNSHEDATVMAWWDYGYQLAGMANRTTIVDNNTWNNTHIATVGRAMASSEDKAYPLLRQLDVDYVLVIFGGLIGYSGDDINKFLWMVRIGQGVYPDHVSERKFFTSQGEYRIDDAATPTMRASIMYKMCYHRFNDVFGKVGTDRVRGSHIQSKPITFHTMDEAYTSEHWIVRIYKVRNPDFLGRTQRAADAFARGRPLRKTKTAKDLV